MATELNKTQSEFLEKSIYQWQQQGLIDDSTARSLRNSYQTKHFQWKRVAQYSFWLAVVSGAVSVGSLFISQQFINFLRRLYYTPNIVIAMLSAITAMAGYLYAWRKRNGRRGTILSAEAVLLASILLTANALGYFTRAAALPSSTYGFIILFAGVLYGVLAITFRSVMVWLFALLSIYIGFFTQTTHAGHVVHIYGFNVIIQALFLSSLLLVASVLMLRNPKLSPFVAASYLVNLSVFFVALWLLSIFGNTLSLSQWLVQRQIHLLGWAVAATTTCGLLVAWGIYKRNDYLQNFGIAFLIINLYTRYFELLYNSLNKALFFSVLAVSFWLLGRWAEKHWKRQSPK